MLLTFSLFSLLQASLKVPFVNRISIFSQETTISQENNWDDVEPSSQTTLTFL